MTSRALRRTYRGSRPSRVAQPFTKPCPVSAGRTRPTSRVRRGVNSRTACTSCAPRVTDVAGNTAVSPPLDVLHAAGELIPARPRVPRGESAVWRVGSSGVATAARFGSSRAVGRLNACVRWIGAFVSRTLQLRRERFRAGAVGSHVALRSGASRSASVRREPRSRRSKPTRKRSASPIALPRGSSRDISFEYWPEPSCFRDHSRRRTIDGAGSGWRHVEDVDQGRAQRARR